MTFYLDIFAIIKVIEYWDIFTAQPILHTDIRNTRLQKIYLKKNQGGKCPFRLEYIFRFLLSIYLNKEMRLFFNILPETEHLFEPAKCGLDPLRN